MMLSFATEFPVNHSHSADDFLCAIRDWILGSPHTVFNSEDLDGIECKGEWCTCKDSERIDVLAFKSPQQDSAAAKYSRTEAGLEWVTTIVFSRITTNSWVGIRISCESKHPATRLPSAKKPVVVRTLLEQLGGALDGPLNVSNSPHILKDRDIDVAAGLITGQTIYRLPIVYVSSGYTGDIEIDPNRLADDLAGMAHVVVEPNRAFSLRLKIEVNSANVYGGTIGLYWPEGAGRQSFFIGSRYESPADLRKAIVDELWLALVNRRPFDRCTWAAVQQLVSRNAFDSLKTAGSHEVSKYVDEFDKELQAKDEQLADANREISRLQAEVRKHQLRNPMGMGLALQTGQEQDLFAGEILDVVRDALQDAVNHVPQDSRRSHILSAILSANPAGGEATRLRNTIKELLRGSSTVDSKIRRGLESLGFEIIDDGKHCKIVFRNDERYVFSLPKSGSDHRGGLNAASDIGRLLF